MKKQGKSPTDNLDQLREKAEAIQKKIDNQPVEQLSGPDAQKLIQELHLYQIELEMQNEQLRMVTEELERSVMKYEDLFDFAPVGYLTLDPFGLVLEANLTCTRLLNIDRKLLAGARLSRFVAPENFNRFTAFLNQLGKTDAKTTSEFTFIRPDKTFLEARLEGISLKVNSPAQVQYRIALTDISEQKAAERQSRQSQEFVQKIAETMPDILTIYDLDKKMNLYVNRGIETILGISPEKVRIMGTQNLMQLVHPDDLAGLQQNMQAARQLHNGDVSEFEYRIRNAEDNWIWLRLRTVVFQRSPAGVVTQILSVQKDITLKKLAEEELRFKNQIIEDLQTNLPIVVSVIQPDGTFETMTGSGLRSLDNIGVGNLQGQNIFELFPDLEPVIKTVFRTGEKVSYVYCIGPDQKTCFQNYVFRDPTQNVAISFSIDISEQMAAEKIILAEREFSQSLLDNSVDGILAFDADLRFTAWNQVMEQLLNLSKADILGKKVFDLFPAFAGSEVGESLAKVLNGEKVILYDLTFNIKNGLFEAYFNPLISEAGKVSGGLCILHNISLQKKLEEESTQLKLDQQKEILNAVLATQEDERRRIAESLHNGVGQLLYASKLNLERNTTDNPDNRQLLHELLDEAIRETRTISFELMPRILEDFGLETALNELVSRISKSGLELQFHASGLKRFSPVVEIAAYRIIQELINNIIKHSKATVAGLEVVRENDRLHISVKDNGIGFEPGEVAKLHKGIGLTGMLNRVKLLDGKMTIESQPGKGTTISIELQLT
jgi:PAS domain S-box-containing protein